MSAALFCPCNHHKIVPLMIILIGATFLLNAFQVLPVGIVAFVWPVLLMVAGVAKLSGRSCSCCERG